MNAIAKPAAMAAATQTYAELDVDDISASPLNHRKIFRGLQELGESMVAKGQKVPIKVRPTPKGETKYELVYGERRWRAAKLVKMPRLKALIEELTDLQVLEEQLVENVTREDVHPLEEADAYKLLLDKHGYDVDALAAKAGKSKAYIYARLKLCDLVGGVARVAFGEEKINASIALLIARIPNPKLQDRATREILEGPDDIDSQLVHGEWIKVKRPMSFREAQIHLQQNYMLRLEDAPFPITDDKLVKGVGSCVGCLYRTGNQRELFDDVKSADVCTNPPCFAKKKDAQLERETAKLIKLGKKVLSKADAAKVFEQRGATLEYHLGWNSTYAEADKAAPWDIDRKGRTWDVLFGGKDEVPLIFAMDPSGKQWRLIHKAAAVKTLQKSGVLKEKKSKSASSRYISGNKPKVQTPEERIEARFYRKLLEVLAEKVDAKLAKNDVAAWKWLAQWAIEFSCLGEGYFPLKSLAGVQDHGGIGTSAKVEEILFEKAKSAADHRRMLAIAAAADKLGMGGAPKDLDKLCKPFGVDHKKAKAEAETEVKAELEKAAIEKKAKANGATPAKKK